jgi:flagellar motor switch protein FliG
MSAEGIKKAVLLLMSLGENEAAEAFRYLDPGEVQKISVAMAALKNVTRSDIGVVLEDFIEETKTHTTLSLDSKDYIRSVLNMALGEDKADSVIDRILFGDIAGIEGLKWMDAPAVAELIKNEHPQIIATVLVHLDPDQASKILEAFVERTRNDVLLRIATLDGIQPVALRELDEALTELLSGGDNMKRSRAVGGVRVAAEILNFLSSQHEGAVIENIRGYDADLAQQIIDQMFTFEKLIELDDRSIQLLLKEVEAETLIIALKVGPPGLRQKFAANMSQRAAELFLEDLEARGPMRLSEVEAQQRNVLQAARGLAESGAITLGTKPDEAYV